MKTIFLNWRTTLAGLATALPAILNGIATNDKAQIWTGISALLLGLFAKDSNK